MKPYYQDEFATIYHGDCREIAPSLSFDAVISDPPYGMDWDTDSTRFSGGTRKRGEGKRWRKVRGDAEPFDPLPWVSCEWVVLFGYHHFASRLPVGSVLVWIKKHDDLFGTFLSDAELAWKKGGHGVYAFRRNGGNCARVQDTGVALHPTQKPESLMRWCIERSGAPESAVILDPFMGSGTTLRAAKNMGRKAIGIELDEKYCEVAAERLAQGCLPWGAEATT